MTVRLPTQHTRSMNLLKKFRTFLSKGKRSYLNLSDDERERSGRSKVKLDKNERAMITTMAIMKFIVGGTDEELRRLV